MVSFHGERATVKKELQQVAVKDVMSKKVITFSPEQKIAEVVNILITKKISGGPVCDGSNNLVGIISEGDCLKQVIRGKYNHMPQQSSLVQDCMVKEVKTMSPDMDVLEAAAMFLDLKLRRFPVMEDGKLIGQVSQRDVMRAVLDLKDATW